MVDLAQKTETIHRIQALKLAQHLVAALEDAQQAVAVQEALSCLEQLTEQWY